jgi:hypothetical protein
LLDLNLDFCFIENEGAKALSLALPLLKNLKILRLHLNSKNFGGNGFSDIVYGIIPLKLDELQLEAAVNRVGVEGANSLKLLLNS